MASLTFSSPQILIVGAHKMSGGIVFTVYENMIEFLAFMDPGNLYI